MVFSKIEETKVKICIEKMISSYFVVPKLDGTNRFILNLKHFNKFVETEHFKLEDIHSALNMIDPEDYMCRVGLKDAYLSVLIYSEQRKFLRFKFNNVTLQFKALPFGLSSSPYIFTKLMKPVVDFLRKIGFRMIVYLDDFLIFGHTRQECSNNVKFLIKLLCFLGFIVNLE